MPASSPLNYRLAHKGCAIFILVRFDEHHQPRTTFYIFANEAARQALVHEFYHDLGSLPQVEALLKSWVDAYRRNEATTAAVYLPSS